MNIWNQIELDNYNRVQIGTFGHLAPKRNVAKKGFIQFSLSAYGDITVMNAEFEDTSDSPWLYKAMNDFAAKHVMKLEDGDHGVFRFEGTMTFFKNGAFRFSGKTRRMKLEYARRPRISKPRPGIVKH